ncbi:hypothetical protein [Actinomadura nitritigenes]|uniref:hypothetical protein n=1 Tax=Actinomadura nitritigenes TaxID=134602 RepID=UPI003D92449A
MSSWHRWVTLAMLAHAFLAVTAAAERHDRPVSDGLIPLTGNEIQHLFAAMISPIETSHTVCAGPTGDADIKPAPATARTTRRRPPGREDHDPRLEY